MLRECVKESSLWSGWNGKASEGSAVDLPRMGRNWLSQEELGRHWPWGTLVGEHRSWKAKGFFLICKMGPIITAALQSFCEELVG